MRSDLYFLTVVASAVICGVAELRSVETRVAASLVDESAIGGEGARVVRGVEVEPGALGNLLASSLALLRGGRHSSSHEGSEAIACGGHFKNGSCAFTALKF